MIRYEHYNIQAWMPANDSVRSWKFLGSATLSHGSLCMHIENENLFHFVTARLLSHESWQSAGELWHLGVDRCPGRRPFDTRERWINIDNYRTIDEKQKKKTRYCVNNVAEVRIVLRPTPPTLGSRTTPNEARGRTKVHRFQLEMHLAVCTTLGERFSQNTNPHRTLHVNWFSSSQSAHKTNRKTLSNRGAPNYYILFYSW